MAETFRVPAIDTTSRDFASLRDDMIALIPFFTTEWTDFNPSDPGITLLELVAYVGDGLHWYVDRVMGEARLETAVSEFSVRNHLKLVDYFPDDAAAAVGTVTFTVPVAATSATEYVIPKGTQISTGSLTSPSIFFETTHDLILPVTTTSGTVEVIQGKTIGQVPPNGEIVGTSNGLPFQKLTLAETPTVAGTVRAFVDEGGAGAYIEYTKVDTFADEPPQARIFREVREADGKTSLLFGDSINGKVPPPTAEIQAAYLVGGGAQGIVGANTIRTIVSALPSGVAGSVTNLESTAGGRDRPTIPEMKQLSQLAARAQNRAVVPEDYKSLARRIPGVVTASGAFVAESQRFKLAISDGEGSPNQTLINRVRDFIDERDVLGIGLSVGGPTEVFIDIDATIVVKPNASRSRIATLADAALDQYFSVGVFEGTADFGASVYVSDISALIDNINGVDHVDFVKLTRRPTLDLQNWRAKDASLSVGVGLLNQVEQTICITLGDEVVLGQDVTFTASGSVSGKFGVTGVARFDDGTGAISAVSLSAPGVEVSVSILFAQNGTIPAPRDAFVVKVGPASGNQTLSGDELRRKGSISRVVTGGVA